MKDNMQSLIEERIYQQFIKPTNQKKDFIGIEIEVPIINLNKQAVDFGIVHKVTSKVLDHFKDFKKEGIDYNGDIFSIKNPKNDDIICYDCSYNNIEFAMGREKDLFTINSHSRIIRMFLCIFTTILHMECFHPLHRFNWTSTRTIWSRP